MRRVAKTGTRSSRAAMGTMARKEPMSPRKLSSSFHSHSWSFRGMEGWMPKAVVKNSDMCSELWTEKCCQGWISLGL